MKKIVSLPLMLILIVNLTAQTTVRSLGEFTTLNLKNTLEVRLVQGEKNEALISVPGSPEDQLDHVITELVGGELTIYTDGKIKSRENAVVVLTFKNLTEINQSGASRISTLNKIRTEKFKVVGSGAVQADINIDAQTLDIRASGASDIKLKGSANKFNLELSGSSDLKASDFKAKNVVIDVSGASDVKVFASESISGRAKGASHINVKGNPIHRAINSSSSTDTYYIGNDNVSINLGETAVNVNDEHVDLSTKNKEVHVHDDTTRVKLGGTYITFIDDSIHVYKKPKKRRNHWAGLDLGINGFMTSGGSFDLSNPAHFEQTNPQSVTQFMELNYSKSWTFSVNFLEFFIPIKEHHFGFVTGLGTEWNNYELKHNVRLTPFGGSEVFSSANAYEERYTWGEIDTTLSYSKNRFKTWFINAPFLLELNTGQDKRRSFHLSAGAILGYNLQTKMKYVFNENGDKRKEKDKDSFNTNPFRASLTARVGYSWFTVFATYALTPLFENGRGPELYPFTVGVALLGF